MDFGALRAKAEAMLDAAEPVVAEAPQVETPTLVAVPAEAKTETPPVATPETPEAKSAEAALAELADDALVKVVVDGEEQVVPWKEAKAGYSRTAKFTKSMQQVAQERKQLEDTKSHIATLEQQANTLRAFLQDKNAVLQFVQQAFPEVTPQAPVGNPDEITTVAQAEAIARSQVATVEQRLTAMQIATEQKIQSELAKVENLRQTAAHAAKISSTLTDIFTKNPVLNAIPNAEDLIRFNVAKLNPQTEAEALEAFHQVAQGVVEDIGKHFKANEKIQRVAQAKAKLESSSIEPAGGSAPQVQPTNFKNTDGSVNWNAVAKAARDMI